MSQPLLDKVYLDDVLVNFSVYGRYHAVTAVWITLAMIYSGIIFNNHVFVTEAVQYRCVDNHDARNNGSALFKVSNAHDALSWCTNPELCTQWVYDNPNSFAAEFQLACQDWKRTLVGSAHNFGYMVGLLIVGPLSDKLGRKPLIIIIGLIGAACGLAKSFVNFYWFYVLLEFLEAAIGDPSSPLYMLSIELVATKSRVKYTTACKIGLSIGGIIFPLMYWLISYWRTFLKTLYAPPLLFICAIYYLDESPRWLLSKGNTEAAVKIIDNASKMNKIEIKENLAMLSYEEDASLDFKTVLVATLKSRTLLKTFFACVTWWITSTFVSHGLSINSVFLKGNKFINYALASVVEIPGNIFAAYLMDKFNRKLPLIFSFVACAVLCAVQPFIPNDLLWLTISIYMVGKLVSTTFFTITYIFTSELFPTYTRNSMHALCSSVGRIGGLAAPQTPLLRVYWSGLSTVLFSVVSLIAGLVTILVPDTGDKSLPDTVLQAEALSYTKTDVQLEENRAGIARKNCNEA
ncbi:solute carrier family 22 member 1-like isoform X1 [Choristoneura fumiferana]|uniref:solute carrier family 22 member 1-like isoform X1 n=1 Tax=Choristoneura fumiferana TaxID=7141 RepID=UPI003D15565A